MNKKVLFIVDDDEDDISLFVEAINEIEKSATCFKAMDGEDALERLDNLDLLPDIIFLDLNMPKMNGREVLQNLKETERYKNIPVVIYSTSSDDWDKKDAYQLGASDFLTKPESFTQLCITLSRTIRENITDSQELDARYIDSPGSRI